jgi:histidinol phosphatase-like enzyme
MKIIFLDIDGVLNSIKFMNQCYNDGINPDDKIDFKAVELLSDLVKQADAKIVISSCWRLPFLDYNNLEGLRELLVVRNNLPDVIIGMTPEVWEPGKRKTRGNEIQKWIDDCGIDIESFVIIDDDSDMEHLSPFLVKTKVSDGLKLEHIIKAMIILENKNV